MSIESISLPDVHAARIMFDLRAQELLHLGKRYNLIKFSFYFSSSHTQNCTVRLSSC
jgi:hypothetical protein